MTQAAEITALERITARRRQPSLNLLDIALQTLNVVMLVAAIVAVQMRMPCYLYLVAAPILSIALWASAGLVIDRQALRGHALRGHALRGHALRGRARG